MLAQRRGLCQVSLRSSSVSVRRTVNYDTITSVPRDVICVKRLGFGLGERGVVFI